ncbi:hypothetical protein EDF77_2193 [Stenotrophomonas maltophilia]|uniref:hypothetical protein n=1 Tax=Stenotrophomonas chelatiphaga TaxID=517011 RepID=UPI000F4B6242|nr:hypothetical protein [Stenotrophomonas chelatiphaga]MCS4231766.1 hypothetical protein [Stenotrophomonas chelatiphaga]ROQ41689.1 hypothetical protein EDF77_2193 [Stenotrophomonas maltophilia]
MNTPIRHFRVAHAGLDLLHGTRLKLACSLLLAERMDIRLQPWNGEQADLLVVGGDPSAMAVLQQQARTQGVATLRIVRGATAAPGVLPHGASVRDINQELAGLLGAVGEAPDAAEQPAPAGMPLLLRAMQSPATASLYLLQRGATRVVVDTASRSLALPTGASLSEIVPLLDDLAWSSTPLDADTFQHQYVYLLPRRHSFEALYFCIARHRPQLLPAVAAGTSMQLLHWPDLDHRDVPASWLLPIARLHAASWTSTALAAASGLPHDTVQFLFSAAASSGLAKHQENAVLPSPRPAGLRDSRFLTWVARRFGLDLQAGRA